MNWTPENYDSGMKNSNSFSSFSNFPTMNNEDEPVKPTNNQNNQNNQNNNNGISMLSNIPSSFINNLNSSNTAEMLSFSQGKDEKSKDGTKKDFLSPAKTELSLNDPLYFRALVHCLGQLYFKYNEAAYPVLGITQDEFFQTVITPFHIANNPAQQLITYAVMAMGCLSLGDRKQGDQLIHMALQAASTLINGSPSYETGCGYALVSDYFRSVGKFDDANFYVQLASDSCQKINAFNTNLHKRVLFGMLCSTGSFEAKMKILEELKTMLISADGSSKQQNQENNNTSPLTRNQLDVGIDLATVKVIQLCVMMQNPNNSENNYNYMMQLLKEEEDKANANSTMDPIVKMQVHLTLLQARSFLNKMVSGSNETPTALATKDAEYIAQLLRKSNFHMCDFAILARGLIHSALVNLHNKVYELLEYTYALLRELAQRFQVLIACFNDLEQSIAECGPHFLVQLKTRGMPGSDSSVLQNDSLLALLSQSNMPFMGGVNPSQQGQFFSPQQQSQQLQPNQFSGISQSQSYPQSQQPQQQQQPQQNPLSQQPQQPQPQQQTGGNSAEILQSKEFLEAQAQAQQMFFGGKNPFSGENNNNPVTQFNTNQNSFTNNTMNMSQSMNNDPLSSSASSSLSSPSFPSNSPPEEQTVPAQVGGSSSQSNSGGQENQSDLFADFLGVPNTGEFSSLLSGSNSGSPSPITPTWFGGPAGESSSNDVYNGEYNDMDHEMLRSLMGFPNNM